MIKSGYSRFEDDGADIPRVFWFGVVFCWKGAVLKQG